MRVLKFRIVTTAYHFTITTTFIPGSQRLNTIEQNTYGPQVFVDQAADYGFTAWNDRTVQDTIGRLYGKFQIIPVHSAIGSLV